MPAMETDLTLALIEAMTSHQYNDVTGTVPVNVCDGLFAIAKSIDRLAAAREAATESGRKGLAEAMREIQNADGNDPGHA